MARLDVSSLGDRELVLLIQATGDGLAFGELVSRHQPSLRAFLWRLSGNRALADDMAQETFVRCYIRIKTLREADRVLPWLFAIAYREFLHSVRKKTIYSRFLDRLARDDSRTPSVSVDERLDLQNCLKALSTSERAAILLCDACGMSHGEASRALDIPLGSVKTYVQRARDKLRVALSAMPEDNNNQEGFGRAR